MASDFLENKYWLEKNSVKPGTQNIWRYISNRPLMKLPHKTYTDLVIKRLGVKEEMDDIVKELVGGNFLNMAE